MKLLLSAVDENGIIIIIIIYKFDIIAIMRAFIYMMKSLTNSLFLSLCRSVASSRLFFFLFLFIFMIIIFIFGKPDNK